MAKVRIPKRVAGVKIPKKVRRKAKKALRLAEKPVVREIAAAALGAVAQGGADRAGDRGRSRGNGRDRAVKALLKVDGDRLAEAIRAAALDGMRRFIDGFEEGLRKATADSAEPDGDGDGEAEAGGRRRRRPSAPAADAPGG
ncbi:MAG TPA: hypothetical protein VN231_11085 [Allosphingosinicella sp.]|nr:hypothetical protein [Allosphingosinicella sp.]